MLCHPPLPLFLSDSFLCSRQLTKGIEPGRVVQVLGRLGEAVSEIGLAGGQVPCCSGERTLPRVVFLFFFSRHARLAASHSLQSISPPVMEHVIKQKNSMFMEQLI